MRLRIELISILSLVLTIVCLCTPCSGQRYAIVDTGQQRPARQLSPMASSELETQTDVSDTEPDILSDPATGDLPPSFVFILADDMGWTGLSCSVDDRVSDSKSDFYQTPRIDTLARQGVRFSNAYSPSSMCTPSRAGLLTGRSPAALRMTTPGPARRQATDRKLIPPRHVESLPDSETTIAEALRAAGYATAHFGKWHLAGGGPGRHGFDRHDGDTGPIDGMTYELNI